MHVKPIDEIMQQLAEIIHRHRRRYIRKYCRPCPNNCAHATESKKRGVTGCSRCKSDNPENCRDIQMFSPIETKEEVAQRFAQDIRDPVILRHEFRDVMSLLWVIGAFDGTQPDEKAVSTAEDHKVRHG